MSNKQLKRMVGGIEYKPYQIDGIRWLAPRDNFILGDQPGLGKTLQVLTTIAIDFERDWAKRVLVVCPNNLKDNWLQEIQKWTDLKAIALANGKPLVRAQQLADFKAEGHEVLVIGYQQIVPHLSEYMAMGFDIAVFDESQALANAKSKQTKGAMKLARHVSRKLFMSGSPLLKNPMDLFPMLNMIYPNQYQNPLWFRSRFCRMGGFQNREVQGVMNAEELHEILDEIMLRRLKADVLKDLPPKQYEKIWVPLSRKQRAMYDEAIATMEITIEGEPDPMELANGMVRFLRLKQIAGTTANVDPATDDSPKLDVVAQKAKEVIESGERTIIFTQFRGTNDGIARRLQKMNIAHHQLHGDVPQDDRPQLLHDWANDPEPSVLIAQIVIAGVGLTLTEASTVIFAEKDFTPGINEQCVDRIHRIGQTASTVRIVEVLCEDSIEERVEQILSKKQGMSDEVIDYKSISRDIYAAVAADAAKLTTTP